MASFYPLAELVNRLADEQQVEAIRRGNATIDSVAEEILEKSLLIKESQSSPRYPKLAQLKRELNYFKTYKEMRVQS